MPHLILEHSPELTGQVGAVAQALYDATYASELVPNKSAIKVRTIACDNVLMATKPQSFAHLTALLLSGRSTAEKAALARLFLDVLVAQLPEVGSLSVDPRELDVETYVKRVL